MANIIILFGIGGLSDVGRHAVLAAAENKSVERITVITEYPEKLNEKNWDCNCLPDGHTNPFDVTDIALKLKLVKVDSWKEEQIDLSKHFQGATAVISALGHRQPGWKYPELIQRGLVAYVGNKQIVKAMEEAKVDRAVVISSFGLRTDKERAWPHWARKFMAFLFSTFMRKARNDLEAMERLYEASSLDYLIVRPVGIGEDKVPVGQYYLQEPNEDAVGGNMAKMDVAKFMVDQAINASLHRTSKVVGSKPGSPM